jgi:hypothetical protein
VESVAVRKRQQLAAIWAVVGVGRTLCSACFLLHLMIDNNERLWLMMIIGEAVPPLRGSNEKAKRSGYQLTAWQSFIIGAK